MTSTKLGSKSVRFMCLFEYEKDITNAFIKDADNILKEYKKMASYKFEDMAQLWNIHHFTFTMADEKYLMAIQMFMDSFFTQITRFIYYSEDPHLKAGALYLLYGLYYKQPIKEWVKIRLTLEEYKNITEFIDLMKSIKEFEPVYIFAKMKVDHAFLYVADKYIRGIEDHIWRRIKPSSENTLPTVSGDTAIEKFQITESNIGYKALKETQKEYLKLLKKYSEKDPNVASFGSYDITKDIVSLKQEMFSAALPSGPQKMVRRTVGARVPKTSGRSKGQSKIMDSENEPDKPAEVAEPEKACQLERIFIKSEVSSNFLDE